jgi:hypothetical protein
MITTSEVKEFIKKYREKCENSEYVTQKKKDAVLQRKLEKEILTSKCIYNLLPEDTTRFYSKVNSNKMTEYTEYNNYDIGLMDVGLSGCSKLYLSTFPGSLENNERVMEWIRNVRYLASISPNEVDFASSITQLRKDYYGSDTFKIKAPALDPDESGKISPERLDCLSHETFVGMFGLNPLRKKGIPNFAYVYGGFESCPPIISPETKKILPWGSSDVPSDMIFYTIFENTNSIETLNESCKNDTYDIILSYFLQVVLALKSAHDYCKYTHYNLHTKNVVLRRHNSAPTLNTIEIEYVLDEMKSPVSKVYIKSPKGNIATIQEFSTNYIHINVDGKPQGFGYNNYDNVPFDDKGIYNDKSFVIGDVYKLLLHILASTYMENKIAYSHLKVMFTFFSLEPLEEVFKNQKDTYFHLPQNEKSEALKIEDFIALVLKKYESSGIISKTPSKYSTKPPYVSVLKTSGNCFEKDESFMKIAKQYDMYCIPRSTIQLYDFIKYYAGLYADTKEQKCIELINKTAEMFEKEFTESVNETEQTRLESISAALNSRFILQEIPYNVNILSKESFKETYMGFISKCILYMNTWERLKVGIKVLEFIEKGGSMFKQLYKNYTDIYNKNKPFYEAIRFNLLRFYTFFACYNLQVENYGSILQGITREKHFEIIKSCLAKPEFQWYFLTASFLKSIWS